MLRNKGQGLCWCANKAARLERRVESGRDFGHAELAEERDDVRKESCG